MFGFFKKKFKISDAAESAVGLLSIQIMLMNPDNKKSSKRLTEMYSRGYIFGFCDVIMKGANLNQASKNYKTQTLEFLEMLELKHRRIFGEKKGEKILLQSFEDQEKSIFCKGANRGIQDFAYYCESNGKPIWVLYGYLHEGKKYFELDGET